MLDNIAVSLEIQKNWREWGLLALPMATVGLVLGTPAVLYRIDMFR